MSELQESVLQIFNCCLEFLIGLFFVGLPILSVVGGRRLVERDDLSWGKEKLYGVEVCSICSDVFLFSPAMIFGDKNEYRQLWIYIIGLYYTLE